MDKSGVQRARKAANEKLDPPWEGVFRLSAFFFNRALRKSMPAGHVLEDGLWVAIARDRNSDDVLFASADGRIAKVHLTYRAETDPRFPATAFFASIEDFQNWLNEEQAYIAGLLDKDGPTLRCTQCGADWTEGHYGPACQTCGGFALHRPCPICDGACGATWKRAVLDSNDIGEAHWIGACRARQG